MFIETPTNQREYICSFALYAPPSTYMNVSNFSKNTDSKTWTWTACPARAQCSTTCLGGFNHFENNHQFIGKYAQERTRHF